MRAHALMWLTLLVLAGCSPGTPDEDASGSAWAGTITTEGDVTTVVNESGSLWEGTGSLVEEVSIGVEAGADEYMFGSINGVYATDDEIYVLDGQKPALRVYDFEGRHLRDHGAAGEGPGEFRRPYYVKGTGDGTILVMARGLRRMNLYGPEAGAVDSWPLSRMVQCCIRPFAVAPDGTAWVEIGVVDRERLALDSGMQQHGPDGELGDPFMVPELTYERFTYTRDGREIESVQYAPEVVWAIAPPGLLVAGANDRYRFEIHAPGGPVTVIERRVDPIPLSEPEIAYANAMMERRRYSEAGREVDFSWDGRLPVNKPAYSFFLPTESGMIWVFREGPADPIADCDPSETVDSAFSGGRPLPKRCFNVERAVDAFDMEGRFLGEVDLAARIGFLHPVNTHVRGDTVITTTQDEMGTITVKRYRLVLPDEESR